MPVFEVARRERAGAVDGEQRRPAERSRNERRLMPVPAGSGMPGSIAGSPRPAWATPARSSWSA